MHDGLRRVASILLLAIVFVGLMTHYGGAAPQHELTKTSITKLQSPDEHVGETVHVWARVARTDDALVVKVTDFTVTVDGAETTAQPGDAIQVYGTIQSDGTIAAERVVVSEQSGLRELYAISTVALVLTLVAFFRSWRIDVQRLAFIPREEGVEDDA